MLDDSCGDERIHAADAVSQSERGVVRHGLVKPVLRRPDKVEALDELLNTPHLGGVTAAKEQFKRYKPWNTRCFGESGEPRNRVRLLARRSMQMSVSTSFMSQRRASRRPF